MLGPCMYGFFLLRAIYSFLHEPPEVLHEDIIIYNIITWLPAQKVQELRCVCKSWYNKIETPFFARAHIARSQPGILMQRKYKDITSRSNIFTELLNQHDQYTNIMVRDFLSKSSYVWSSCNGLLLCSYSLKKLSNLFVVNPYTKRLLKLPLPANRPWVSVGMTYMVSTGEYKVIYVSLNGCDILTPAKGMWKTIHSSSYTSLESKTLSVWRIKFTGDVAHWVTMESSKQDKNVKFSVFTFDLIEMKLYETNCPYHLGRHPPFEYEGLLSFACQVNGHPGKFEIWSLKDFSGKWCKQQPVIELEGVSLEDCRDLQAVTYFGKSRIIIFKRSNPLLLYAYDVQLKQTTRLDLDSENMYGNVFQHTDSLVSFKDSLVCFKETSDVKLNAL